MPHENSNDYLMDEGLIQEVYCADPWKMLVGCILLNKTSHKQVRSVITQFFNKWPSAEIASKADEAEMAKVLKPLGLYNRRAATIKKFSKTYVDSIDHINDVEFKISKFPGIGKYAEDSYEIFVKKNLNVEPSDKELKKYLNK